MQTKACLKPGQNGTKKWNEIYGDRLVTVRYRYDADKKRRYTTVEIIVEEGDWRLNQKRPQDKIKPMDMLGIRVAGYETEIRRQVKAAGGIWRPRQQLWELSYGKIVTLGLEDRIVHENPDRETDAIAARGE